MDYTGIDRFILGCILVNKGSEFFHRSSKLGGYDEFVERHKHKGANEEHIEEEGKNSCLSRGWTEMLWGHFFVTGGCKLSRYYS